MTGGGYGEALQFDQWALRDVLLHERSELRVVAEIHAQECFKSGTKAKRLRAVDPAGGVWTGTRWSSKQYGELP